MEHSGLVVYSYPALSSRKVQYWVRPCSSPECQRRLSPEGSNCGLLIMGDKLAYDHQWLFEKMDDIDVDGTTQSASYEKMRLSYERSYSQVRPPGWRQYKAACLAFRHLLDEGAHATAMSDGIPLFECPKCGPPDKAELVIDGTCIGQSKDKTSWKPSPAPPDDAAEVCGIRYADMVGLQNAELRELVLRFTRSYTIQRRTSATQRSYQQRVMKEPLSQAEYQHMIQIIQSNENNGTHQFLEAAISEVPLHNFNCPDTVDKKTSVLCRVLQAVAAKGLAYPLINNPHLLGPLFVQLGEDHNGGSGLDACCMLHSYHTSSYILRFISYCIIYSSIHVIL